ncbi:MAG: discoidin domain-containing protein [Clostridiales bacterium]|nr:discoidin domain-containing protein [Clostridiales bacterium]
MKPNEYLINFLKEGDKYVFTFGKNGAVYSTVGGALGVRFDKNEFRADDPIYADYDGYSEVDGGYKAYGEVASDFGSVIAFEDYFSVSDGRLFVDRQFYVKKVGEDYGFATEFKITGQSGGTIGDSDWFIPANYYVTGEHTFSQSYSRIYYDGSAMVIPADDVSLLMATQYKDNTAFTMLDLTAGYRENIIDDRISGSTLLYIDESINLPGIGIGQENENVSFSHFYPSHTNRSRGVYIWRLLPVEEGLKRTVSFSISVDEHGSYAEMLKKEWRNAFDLFAVQDRRYNTDDIYEVLVDTVQRSYSLSEWNGVPQYMTITDHFFPDSGFLYRNLELATLMLKEGRKRGRLDMINNAKTVISRQIDDDRLDKNIQAYKPDNSVFYRVLFDSLEAAVNLYVYEVTAEPSESSFDSAFMNKLLNYIIDKAELYKDVRSAMAMSFYSAVVRNQDIIYVDYTDTLLAVAEEIYSSTEDFKGFYGGVENTNPNLSVAEDYMIILRAFLDIYDITGDKKWLNKSIIIGDYMETYQMTQMVNLNLKGATGLEDYGNKVYNLAFIGNERFTAHGYIFNNTSHGILDIANASSVRDYYRLYTHTQDGHYLDFAGTKLYNTLIYVNMGDKIGHMDDIKNSGGLGFMNEFVGNSTFSNGFVDGGIRGAAHDSNIAWNVYQIISMLDWFNENCGATVPEGIGKSLIHDLAKRRLTSATSELSPVYSAGKAVDNADSTCWTPSADDAVRALTVDLNEFCDIDNIQITALKAERDTTATVELSDDGVLFAAAGSIIVGAGASAVKSGLEIKKTAKYVRVNFDNICSIAAVEVNGVPVKYETLSYDAIVLAANSQATAVNCIDKMNYKTAWSAGSVDAPRSITLDLNEEHDIYQTAFKFANDADYQYKIEISSDNSTYSVYADRSSDTTKRLVHVDARYAKARYVKLTLLSSQNAPSFSLQDFKVMGKA